MVEAPILAPSGGRLQVLHVITRYLRGGSEARLRDIIEALPEADHHLICGADSDLDLLRRDLRAELVAREPSLVREPGPKDLVAFRRLRTAMRARPYDLIVTHQSKAGVLTRVSANGTPVVHSLSMANFGDGYPGWQDKLFRRIEHALARKTAAYAVVGADLAARYRSIGVPGDKLHVVRSGVRLPEPVADRAVVRARAGVPDGRPLILYLGSLEARKGVLDLPSYAARLLADAAERPFLLIAGEGPLRDDLAAQILERGLEYDILLAGFVDEPGELVAAADLMVLLSRAEGISQALVQAAAAGTPFVSTDADGARELLSLGAEGRVVPTGDVEAAAAASLALLRRADPVRRPIDTTAWERTAITEGYRSLVREVVAAAPAGARTPEPAEVEPRAPEPVEIEPVQVEPRAPEPVAVDAAIALDDDTVEPARPTPAAAAVPPRGGKSLSRRAGLNAAAGALDQVARMLVELIITPILIRGLGEAVYGTWRVLWRWTGYVWAMGGRSAQALQWVVANKQHVADDEEKQRYVGAAIAVFFVFLPALLIPGLIGAWFAPALLSTPPDLVLAVRITGALLVLDSVLMTLMTIPKAVLQGENLGYKRLGLTTILTFIGGGGSVLAVALGAGIAGVAGAHAGLTVLTGLLFWRIAKRYLPWFRARRPDRAMVRWFLGLSWWFTAWKMVNQAMLAGDVLVLGIVASVEDVTVLSVTRYVPEALMALIITAFQGAAPGLGGIIGSGQIERAREIRAEVMRLTWLVTTAVGAGIIVWNAAFVRIWVDPDQYAGPIAGLMIVAMVVQFIFIRTDAQIIDLTLQMRSKVVLAGISTALALGLAVLGLRMGWGITGLVAGVMTGRLLLSVLYPLHVGRMLHASLGSQLRGAIRPVLVTAAMFTGAMMLGERVADASIVGLIGGSAATGLAAMGLAAVAGLSAEHRRGLIGRARSVVKR